MVVTGQYGTSLLSFSDTAQVEMTLVKLAR